MSAAVDTVGEVIREALVTARALGRIRAFQYDERERALVVEVMEPGLGVHHHRRFVTVEIYEEHHL